MSALLTKTFGGLTFRIDRPKGTVKEWPQPDGRVKRFVYPCDYGYLARHIGEDGEALDFFVGDDPDGHLESFQKLKRDGLGREVLDETKFLVGVTDVERETIYRLYGPEIWHRKVYRDVDELTRDLMKFRRGKVAALSPYDVLAKEAGAMDALRRAGNAVRGFFDGHQPTMMPPANTRPHAEIVQRPTPVSRPATPPPPPSHMPQPGSGPQHPTQPMPLYPPQPPQPAQRMATQAGPRHPQLPPQTIPGGPSIPVTRHDGVVDLSSKSRTLSGVGPSPIGPTTPAHAVIPASGYKPYTEGLSTEGLKPTGRTPVERTRMSDMILQAPGAREAFSDPRVRSAFNARVTDDGRLLTARPGTVNAMAEHLMRTNPSQVTPELLLSAMRDPAYGAIRSTYKGAAMAGKYAALVRYGFKLADAKFADIDKTINGEVTLVGNERALADAFKALQPPWPTSGELASAP